jgi:hypothetical protein
METAKKAKVEDIKREASLRRAISKLRPGTKRKRLGRLLNRLVAARQQGTLYPSLASYNYSRKLRRAETKIVVEELAAYAPEDRACFHAVTAKWAFPEANLLGFDIVKFVESVRYHFRVCGAYEEDGFLIARLHGESEPHSKKIWPHFHGCAAGGMVKVMDRLATYYSDYDVAAKPPRKIFVQPAKDLNEQASYIFQSFWPCRYRGPASDNPDKEVRQRLKQRMADVVHADWLLLMDNADPSDLMIVIGSKSLAMKLSGAHRRIKSNAMLNYLAPVDDTFRLLVDHLKGRE